MRQAARTPSARWRVFGAHTGLTLADRGLGDLPGTRSTGEVEGVIYAGAPPPWDETLSE